MFEYFPDNYAWSLTVMIGLGMGAEIGEIDSICRPLRHVAGRNDEEAEARFFAAWCEEGERLAALAADDEYAGRARAASRKYLRASTYKLLAERQVRHKHGPSLDCYRSGLADFRRGVELSDRAVEHVDVPYGDSSLPAMFLPGAGPGPHPCIIHFDGLDVMKEIIYLLHLYELPDYGVSVLICDHPGVGEALRLRSLFLTEETEKPAGACVDYLEERPDVDSERIGIMALSLGGYHAPRAAAFEKRLKCCVVWGGIWDLQEIWELAKDPEHATSVSFDDQFAWVFGTDDAEEVERRVKLFRLEPLIDRLTCPILTLHGANDRQAPLWLAERTHEAAINSAHRELKVLSLEEGGAEHCQIDNVTMGTDYMFWWIAETLGNGKAPPISVDGTRAAGVPVAGA